jgi:hypothetical protein
MESLKNPRAQHIIVAVILLLMFTGLYVRTRTQSHTFDALSYTQDVENKPFSELYHPHHLLYGPVGRIAFDAAQIVGYDGRADAPIQFLNAVAGALGVILLWQFGGRFSGRMWPALGVAMLVGVTFAFWLYATEVEVYTFAAVFVIASMGLLLWLEDDPTPRKAVLLGMTCAAAVMFHQTNAMFALPVSVFLLSDASRRKLVILYWISFGLAVGLPYLLVGWTSGFRSPDDFYTWATDYAQTGTWGGNLNTDSLPALRDGLLNTISNDATFAWMFYALATLGVVMGVRHLWQERRGWLFFGLAWMIPYGAFFWWWEPWNIEFWIVLLPLWAFWMFSGLQSRAIPVLAIVLAALTFNAHYDPLREATNPQNDYYQQITLALEPRLTENDWVVTRGNILDLYLPFYADFPPSNVISLRELSFGDADPIEALMSRIDFAHRRGQIVYIDQLVLDEPFDGQRNPFGLAAADITQIENSFPISENVSYNGQNVFYSIGMRAAGPEWIFDEHLGGWLEKGAGDPRFEDGGWCITGGGDPWLESPPLQIDASTHTMLTVELSIDDPADYGQVFWQRADEGLDEARSLRFPLEVGRQVYALNLANQPGWKDTIVFLRLDPIPENLDVNACIYQITVED